MRHTPRCRDVSTGETTTFETDALVFAVGVTGMQKIVQANPALGTRPEFRRMMNLRGIDVVSTRLWLDKRVATQFPANVLAGFDDNMGSTYFNLNELQARLLSAARVLPGAACSRGQSSDNSAALGDVLCLHLVGSCANARHAMHA